MKRNFVIGLGLVAFAASVVLFCWPRARPPRLAWNMAQLGGAIALYAGEHDGRMPASVDELVSGELLHPKVGAVLNERVRYLTPGCLASSLPPDVIVAVEEPNPGTVVVEGQVTVLTADGNVIGVPIGDLRGAALTPGTLWAATEAGGGHYRVAVAEPLPATRGAGERANP